jgi:hypothetical protein
MSSGPLEDPVEEIVVDPGDGTYRVYRLDVDSDLVNRWTTSYVYVAGYGLSEGFKLFAWETEQEARQDAKQSVKNGFWRVDDNGNRRYYPACAIKHVTVERLYND